MRIDIGEKCTHCGRETSLGTSLFVNRIPSGADGKLILSGGDDVVVDVDLEGYMCPECQQLECDKCGELAVDYYIMEFSGGVAEIRCTECYEAGKE
jgi:hypothetical protein